jgi:transcriptional regulator with XRE-family HTH domain
MKPTPIDDSKTAETAGGDHAALKIGATIRNFRLQKNLSQGDIERKTGLLRCYLSRVENGHTVPSLETLQKIAHSLDIPLSQMFSEDNIRREFDNLNLSEEEVRFLAAVQRYSSNLTEMDRKLLLTIVKKFAATSVQ